MRFYLFSLFIAFQIWLIGQSVELNIQNSGCISEQIDPSHVTTGITSFVWDFCHNDLSTVTSTTNTLTLTGMNSPQSIKYDYDSSNWYAFVGSRLTDQLYRLNYGNSLTNTPSITNLGNLGVTSLRPNAIEFKKQSGKWVGFVVSQSGEIIRLTYSNRITGSFSVQNLGDLKTWAFVWDFKLVYDSNESKWIGILTDANGDKLTMIDFGSSLLNTPSQVVDIGVGRSDIVNPRGADLIKTASGWYSLIADVGSDQVLLAQFGNNPITQPTFTSILSATNPTKVRIQKEGLNYVAFVITSNSGLYRIDFGSDLNGAISTTALGTFSNLLTPAIAVEVVQDTPYWRAFVLDGSGLKLSRVDFQSTCSSVVSQNFALNSTPESVIYNASGSYLIEFTGKDSYGNIYSDTDTITIHPRTAPTISYTTDNACATTSSSFTASTPGLTYSWDFDEDGLEDSNLENPSFAFGTPGTYTVRLDVDDGTCHNFTKQDITLFAEPPPPSFNITGDLCATNTLSFGNTTNDATYAGPLTYAWDFNGEGSSAVKSPSFAFASGGTKTITLTSSIPGCENITQQVIEVAAGPMASFTANPICQGELMSFTNQSTGADTYVWNFGDGFTSTQSNPGHVYSSGGNFTVTLAATESGDCTTTYQQEVAVSHLPIADFDYDIPCSGSQGIQFSDLSFVTAADILSWNWYIDNVLTATEQNPVISFDEAGTHTVRLEVMSSNGCSSSSEQSLQVLGTPVPSFDADVNCQGQTSVFTDTTPGAVSSRRWTINGQVYTSANVNHVFASSGNFNVSLAVTSSDFCTSTTSAMVTVTAAPALDFDISSDCLGDAILLTDLSTSTDPIVSRTWSYDGVPFFNGAQALLSGAAVGDHTLSLTVQTASGCSFATTQAVTLKASPSASFTSSTTVGAAPFFVSFTNTSSGAVSYVWRVNGTEVSTSPNLTQLFNGLGSQTVELTAIGANGCETKASTTISSVIPAVDLKVGEVNVIANNSIRNINLTIRNEGNLPITRFDVVVREGKLQFSERFTDPIGIGEEIAVGLSSSLPMSSSGSLCLSVVSAYTDIQPDDNDYCLASAGLILENPYPNPITDEAVFRLILSSEQSVRLSVIHVSGRTLIDEELMDLSAGLHVLRYDASQWKKGIYLVTVRSGSSVVTRKVVK